MNFKVIIIFCLTLFFLSVSNSVYSQSGGRKKEHKNQRGGGFKLSFKRNKSGGHADAFARGGKKGFLARLFKGKKSGGAWVYKSPNSIKDKKGGSQAKLFSRNRTKNKRYRDGILARQNKQRSGSRESNFHQKKR